MKSLRMIKLVLFIPLLSACAPAAINPITLPDAKQFSPSVATEYRIQTGDSLEIKFFYNPELNELVTVRPDGRISLQLANEVKVAGLTPSELTDQLKKKYSAEIDKPEIAVIVRTFTSQRVYVDGEVNRAGLVQLTEPMTVLQAISQAGGFKDSARANEVIILRRNMENKLTTIVVNLEKAMNNSDMAQDLILMANDVVVVPKSHVANVNKWIDQYIRKNIPIPIGVNIW